MSKIKKALLFTLAGAAFWINASAALAASSWGSAYEIIHVGGTIQLYYDWGIDMEGPPANNRISCGATRCYFGPIPRTGLGPSGTGVGDCDQGGYCNGQGDNRQAMIIVSNNITYQEAYEQYVKARGQTGNIRLTPGGRVWLSEATAWGALCVGFATLPTTRHAVSQLAQNASCGVISPIGLSCTTTIPSTLDFGQINLGENSMKIAQGTGVATCNRTANMRVSILGEQPTIAGNSIQLTINDKQIYNAGQAPTGILIATGSNVNLAFKATVNGPFNTVGKFISTTTLLFAFD